MRFEQVHSDPLGYFLSGEPFEVEILIIPPYSIVS